MKRSTVAIFALVIGIAVAVVVMMMPGSSYAQRDLTATATNAAEPMMATLQAQMDGAAGPVTVACERFPLYCVPLIGGGEEDSPLAEVETADSRTLDMDSQGEPGVARGVMPDGSLFIGDPDAPIHFKVFEDFSCPHCQNYHPDLTRFVETYVVSGQATLELDLLAFVAQPYSTDAAYAALCAGEQGAFWEFQSMLFETGAEQGARVAFTLPALNTAAQDMGLDGSEFADCLQSEKYAPVMTAYGLLANDLGVTGTPTVLVSYGDSGEWTAISREYDNLAQLTDDAQ
jgi:protein-disulfide isomerase